MAYHALDSVLMIVREICGWCWREWGRERAPTLWEPGGVVVDVGQCDIDGGWSRQTSHLTSHVFGLDENSIKLPGLPVHVGQGSPNDTCSGKTCSVQHKGMLCENNLDLLYGYTCVCACACVSERGCICLRMFAYVFVCISYFLLWNKLINYWRDELWTFLLEGI